MMNIQEESVAYLAETAYVYIWDGRVVNIQLAKAK